MSKTIKRYKERLDSVGDAHPFTLSEFRGLMKLFRQKPKTVTQEYWDNFFEEFQETILSKQPRITEEHTRKGLEWLRKSIGYIRRALKKNGGYGLDVIEAAVNTDAFSHFTFYGFCDVTNNFVRSRYPDRRDVLPMWTIHLKDGRRVTYCYSSWQDGRFWTGTQQYF